MKRLNKKLGIFGLLLLTLFAGCSNFDDLNTNPDTSTQVSASMLATNVILRVTAVGVGDGKGLIAQNALPKYVGYANEGQLNEQYNKIGSSDFGGMTLLPNIEKMVEYSKGDVAENSYKGVAKFARALMFFNLTMQMGDIPYSEANQGASGNYRPKYDEQEAIFVSILDELKEADQFFASGVTFSGDPTPYNGDPVKWRRAVNSFALYVLMTLSKKEGVTSLNIKSRFAEIVNTGYILEEGTGYYGLVYSSQNKHPLSGTNDLFTSRTVLSSLLIENLKSLNDRRMYYYAEPAGALILSGKTESDPNAYVGVDVSMDYSAMNAGHSASLGAEASIRATITNAFSLNAAYGYTHATFKDYVSNQKNQAGELVSVNYNGNYIPMVPQNTFSLGAEYGFSFSNSLISRLTFNAQYNGAGKIYWTENNDVTQKFYGILNGKIGVTMKKVQLDLWARNMLDESYATFGFVSSGKTFMQKGKPVQAGIDLRYRF